jgi:hypothetical protein
MMSSAAWSTSCPVILPCDVLSAVWCHPIGPPRTIVVSHEWSTGPALHCSRLFARLAGHDGAACPHVLQAIMALASCTLETCKCVMETRECVLKTCEPSCIGRPAMPFFIYESRNP